MKILKKIVIFLGITFILNGFVSSAYADDVFFSDGFESGDLRHVDSQSNARWGSSNYNDTDSVSVSTDMAHSGDYSLKFVFGPGRGDAWAEQRFWLGSRKRGLYIRFFMRLPSNFKVRNVKPSNNKFVRVWGGEYSGSPGKLGASFIKSRSSHPANVILEGSRCYFDGAWRPDYDRCDYGVLYQGFHFSQSDLDRWLCIEFHLRNDTGDGEGALEMWIDGKKVAGEEGINFRHDSANEPNLFDAGYLLGWSNSGFDERTVIYIDDVVFSDSYIGSSGGGSNEDGGEEGHNGGVGCD
jgi:hypothetical protein